MSKNSFIVLAYLLTTSCSATQNKPNSSNLKKEVKADKNKEPSKGEVTVRKEEQPYIPDLFTSVSSATTGCPPEDVKDLKHYDKNSFANQKHDLWSFSCFGVKYYCYQYLHESIKGGVGVDSKCTRELVKREEETMDDDI